MKLVRRFAVFAMVGAAVCSWTASASAVGGARVATAPTVTYGQTLFGNTATDSPTTYCLGSARQSWWLLPVATGDRVTIDWEGSGVASLRVYPVGTNDFNFENTDDVDHQRRYEAREELAFNANRGGLLPMQFATSDCNFGPDAEPGPYSFTAYVQHALVVSLTKGRSSTRGHTTAFRAAAHTPDGSPVQYPSVRFDLQRRLPSGAWSNLKTITPTQATFGFSYRWARSLLNRWQYLRLRASGPGVITAFSGSVRAKGV